MDNLSESQEDETDLVPLSLTVARYIIGRIATYLASGWGNEWDIEDRPGIIDELPSDSPSHHLLNDILHFLRYLSGVLNNNISLTYGRLEDNDEI